MSGELTFRVVIINEDRNFTFLAVGINIIDALDNFIEFMQQNNLPYREKTRSITITPVNFRGMRVIQV